MDVSTYGTLLIAIIFDCIPEELRVKIALKFGTHEWKLDGTMEIFKSELEARERSIAIIKQKDYQTYDLDSSNYFSTQSLQLASTPESRNRNQNNFVKPPFDRRKVHNNNASASNTHNNFYHAEHRNTCVFCKQNHFSSRCRNVTDIKQRYDIIKRENRCFVCLKKNHRSKDCRLNYTCIKCNKKHNIAICNKRTENNNSQTFSSVVHTEVVKKEQMNDEFSELHNESITNVLNDSSRDEIILQCALANVYSTDGNYTSKSCVLFDGCSQRTYITDKLKEKLKLLCIRKERLILKRFASSEGVLKSLDVVQLCLRGINGINVYMEALCIPHMFTNEGTVYLLD